jgi:hypothetical protein
VDLHHLDEWKINADVRRLIDLGHGNECGFLVLIVTARAFLLLVIWWHFFRPTNIQPFERFKLLCKHYRFYFPYMMTVLLLL